jgi:hypothetical protein
MVNPDLQIVLQFVATAAVADFAFQLQNPGSTNYRTLPALFTVVPERQGCAEKELNPSGS